jgi:hypothetical protein
MPIEHPPPTEGTVKNLYAHAFGCAFEGCRRPLYRIDDETGIRTLNSRVCHIHARREGGPRWDRNQSAEHNRSAENLVLMCIEHATVIDIPETLSAYRPERLRQWKQRQLEDYDSIQQGWALDTEMVQQAIAASVSRAEVVISHSNVDLGGQGGNAPGAGGGGGGAIGRNARGGRGGSGGAHRVDEGDHSLPWPEGAPKRLELNELATLGVDFAPGAGGGGAGAIGDDTTGGDGGDGGDSLSAFIDIAQLRQSGLHHVECIVGKAGENGSDGDDSIVTFLTEDGKVLKTIRASGGKGGGTKAPEGCIEIDARDIENNFRVTTLLLANGFELREGLFFMLGADWTNYPAPCLPFDAVWPVVYSIRWDPREWKEPRVIFLSFLRPDGSEAASHPLVIPTESGLTGVSHGGYGTSVKLDSQGIWSLRLHSGGFMLGLLSIAVTVPASLPVQPQT